MPYPQLSICELADEEVPLCSSTLISDLATNAGRKNEIARLESFRATSVGAVAGTTNYSAMVLMFVLSGLDPCLGANPARRIRFRHGATSAKVKGRLRGIRDERLFWMNPATFAFKW